MELINNTHFKYHRARISYNKFSTREKEMEHNIGCDRNEDYTLLRYSDIKTEENCMSLNRSVDVALGFLNEELQLQSRDDTQRNAK